MITQPPAASSVLTGSSTAWSTTANATAPEWILILQSILALAPGFLTFFEGLFGAINATPGTPEHAAAISKMQQPVG